LIGELLGHYRIKSAIGAGGMGEVFRATDITLGREVALKVLPAEMASNPERLERFKREAKALAALDHPAVSASTPSRSRTASISSPCSSSRDRRSNRSSWAAGWKSL
jgi:serine/threonine protein kinase